MDWTTSAGEAWPAVLLAWPAAGYDLREQLLSGGNDLAVTADLMGHARTDTTRDFQASNHRRRE